MPLELRAWLPSRQLLIQIRNAADKLSQTTAMLSSTQPFIRDRLTWLAYATLAYIGFTQSMLGPLMPFLRDEFNLSYTQGDLLPAALATGLILSGLFGDGFAHRWGRRIVFWSGAVGLAMGQSNLASTRMSLGVGTALLTAPLFLGWLADRLGLRNAYGMVVGLVIAASVIVMNNHLITRRRVAARS